MPTIRFTRSTTTPLGAAFLGALGVALAIGTDITMEAESRQYEANLRATALSHPMDESARAVVEAPEVSQVLISPDGRRIMYAVSRPSIAGSRVATELLVQSITTEGVAEQPPIQIEQFVRERNGGSFNSRWCPDGTCVSFMATGGDDPSGIDGGLMRYDFRLRRALPVPVVDDGNDATPKRPRIRTVGRDYQWSPSGKMIAFTAPLHVAGRLAPPIGVAVTSAIAERGLSFATRPKRGLFALDAATGRVQQLSPASMSVSDFDWAPDEQSLVVSATIGQGDDDTPAQTDLFVIDRGARTVRSLVSQPGNELGPSWSPDGRWISLTSEFGEPHGGGRLAVVSASGGPLLGFATTEVMDIQPNATPRFWTPDSRAFYYSTAYHMTQRLHRADIRTKTIVSLPFEEAASAWELSLTRDTKLVGFERSSLAAPPEVYVRALPDGVPKQVTHLSADFPLTSRVSVEMTHWPSRDGLFTIYGLLLRPRAPVGSAKVRGPEAANTGPLPTLLYIHGGPSMVRNAYALLGSQPALLSLAEHGYAVLVPNTRGRIGYGSAFSRAIQHGASFARLPYEDAMSGIDYLIRRGITDPARLGVFGHSYGGYLTSYAVTQTNLFRAAINFEGPGANYVDLVMQRMPGTAADRSFVKGVGIHNPFTPNELATIVSETPAFNMHCVNTPMLLLFGEHIALKQSSGAVLFSALHRFGIPTEFILFDEGHGITSPMALYDYIIRTTAWFDYWVRELPYHDSALEKKYDAWREEHGASRSPVTACAATPGSH